MVDQYLEVMTMVIKPYPVRVIKKTRPAKGAGCAMMTVERSTAMEWDSFSSGGVGKQRQAHELEMNGTEICCDVTTNSDESSRIT